MSMLHALNEVTSTVMAGAPEPRFDENDVKPGWLGFSVFLAMAAATALLLRSFVKQTKRVDFDEEPPRTDGRAPDDVGVPRTADPDRARTDSATGPDPREP